MGGKNLCVTSQHNNMNSISVQPHHVSLNNGDQTKTTLSTANSQQNAESSITNINVSYILSFYHYYIFILSFDLPPQYLKCFAV